MDADPGVIAGIFTYEIHSVRSFREIRSREFDVFARLERNCFLERQASTPGLNTRSSTTPAFES